MSLPGSIWRLEVASQLIEDGWSELADFRNEQAALDELGRWLASHPERTYRVVRFDAVEIIDGGGVAVANLVNTDPQASEVDQ